MGKQRINYSAIHSIENLYNKAKIAVFVNDYIGDWFKTIDGVGQGFLERTIIDTLEDIRCKMVIGTDKTK